MIVKNTFGCSAVLGVELEKKVRHKTFTGSSLERKKQEKREYKPEEKKEPNKRLERQMSARTKSKIRKKLFAFSQLYKKLTFATFTFVNKVEDEVAVNVLRKFLDNTKKRSKDFQYLWVAERQTKNKTFKGNIHFHLVSNKYWNIEKNWQYWIELQAKHNIKPREENFSPSSAFDVKTISTKNPKSIGTYLTKYVTKNKAKFKCQVWNCSKKISALYTDFYSGYGFLEQLQKLKGNEIKEISLEYCNLHLVPLDKTTIRFYDRLEQKNRLVLNHETKVT